MDNENNGEELSRDEVLASSRNENKNGDERHATIMDKARSIAYGVGLVVSGLVWMISYLVFGDASAAIILIEASMLTTDSSIRYAKLKKRGYLAEAIVGGVLSALMLVLWIFELTGIL